MQFMVVRAKVKYQNQEECKIRSEKKEQLLGMTISRGQEYFLVIRNVQQLNKDKS